MPIPVGLLLARARENRKEDLRTAAAQINVSHTYLYQMEMLTKFTDDLPIETQDKVHSHITNYISPFIPSYRGSKLEQEVHLFFMLSRDKLFLSNMRTFFHWFYVDESHTYGTLFPDIIKLLFEPKDHNLYLRYINQDINFYMQYIFDRSWGSRATKRKTNRKIYNYDFEIINNDKKYIGVFKGSLINGILKAALHVPILYLLLKKCCISTEIPELNNDDFLKWREGTERNVRDILVLDLPQGIHSICFLSASQASDCFYIQPGDVTDNIRFCVDDS